MIDIVISIGDINGIGPEIALRAHSEIKEICNPRYCINKKIFAKCADALGLNIPCGMMFENIVDDETLGNYNINKGVSTKSSGFLSHLSFLKALELVDSKKAEAVVTLPISKEAWSKAGIKYVGHTDMLRDIYKKDAIMVLGVKEMFVALFTEHIPLKDVVSKISTQKIEKFLVDLKNSIYIEKAGVLGVNPHAGDGGVLGDEDFLIKEGILLANKHFGSEIFFGPLVPDTAFISPNRKTFNVFIAMYHDQGLAPLKALYFEDSINISLNLPIIRTSVDHGVAYDRAYNNSNISIASYINAVNAAVDIKKQKQISKQT